MNTGTVRLTIDGAIASELSAICERLRDAPGVRVACLRGAGGAAFVAGTDIEQFKGFDGPAGIAYGACRRSRRSARRCGAGADGAGNCVVTWV